MSTDSRRSNHHRWSRRACAIGAVLAVVIGVAACSTTNSSSGGSADGGSAVGGTLTMSDNFTPVSLNPALTGVGPLSTYLQPDYEPLLTWQPDGSLTPGLATSWKWLTNNNTKFEMTIRQGAKFSDGSPVTAQSVVASINYFRAAKGPFSHSLAGVTSVTVPAPNTVLVVLSTPFSGLPYMFTQSYNGGDIIAPAGIKSPATLATQSLGAGPYMLDTSATVSNTSYTYVPNPYYYDKSAVHWKKIVIKVLTDTNSALQALQAGQIQLMYGDAPTAKSLTGNTNIQVLASPAFWSGIWLQDWNGKTVKALGDVRVRQALEYALNAKAITSALYGTSGTPSNQINGPGYAGYDPALDNAYPYDPAKAKQLLAQAGYPNGFTFQATLANSSEVTSLAQAMVAQLAAVGVKLVLKIESVTSDLAADIFSGKYSGWIVAYAIAPPSLAYQSTILQLPYFGPPTGAAGAQLAALYAKANAATGAAAEQDWLAVYKLITDQAYFTIAARTSSIYFAAKSIKAPAPGQPVYIDPTVITPAG